MQFDKIFCRPLENLCLQFGFFYIFRIYVHVNEFKFTCQNKQKCSKISGKINDPLINGSEKY